MHFMKPFLYLTFLGMFSLIYSSIIFDAQHNALFQKTNQFFDCFESISACELKQLGKEILEVEGLAEMFTKVVSFPKIARRELFFKILQSSLDEKTVFEDFTQLYTTVVVDQFEVLENISLSKNGRSRGPTSTDFLLILKTLSSPVLKKVLTPSINP